MYPIKENKLIDWSRACRLDTPRTTIRKVGLKILSGTCQQQLGSHVSDSNLDDDLTYLQGEISCAYNTKHQILLNLTQLVNVNPFFVFTCYSFKKKWCTNFQHYLHRKFIKIGLIIVITYLIFPARFRSFDE